MKRVDLVVGESYRLQRSGKWRPTVFGRLLALDTYVGPTYSAARAAQRMGSEPVRRQQKSTARPYSNDDFGFPFVRLLDGDDLDRLAALDLTQLDLTLVGPQEVDGVSVRVEVWPAIAIRETVADYQQRQVERQQAEQADAEERARWEAKRQEKVDDVSASFVSWGIAADAVQFSHDDAYADRVTVAVDADTLQTLFARVQTQLADLRRQLRDPVETP